MLQRTLPTFATATTLLTSGAMLVVGCADATDGADTTAETERTSQTLMSARLDHSDADPATLALRYTAVDGWSIDSTGVTSQDGVSTRRQGLSPSGVQKPQGDFSGVSEANVRFSANSGASARYSGTSQSTSTYDGTSNSKSSFRVQGGGSCDLSALCDYAATVCNAYPQAITGQDGGLANGCRSSDIQRCRNNVREFASKASGDAEKSLGYAFLCLFAEFARCAAQGVERAGSISTEREFQQATQRGLASCGFELAE